MDLQIVETGNGGDLVKKTKDLLTIEGFQNMPYLAMFGGNVREDTPTRRIATQQNFDWWGNGLLMPNDQSLQFNSQTERALNTIALTSSGRALIEQAVAADLKFMKAFAQVAVAVSIVATDKLVIGVRLQKPDNLEQRDFIYIWDATLKELTLPYSAGNAPGVPPGNTGFDYNLDFNFI